MAPRPRLLLVGLDGATWRVLNPLLEAGRLPHLGRLIARGASGVLHSLEYSASPVVWTTMATGKWPDRHGIVDFYTPQHRLRAKRIWEILAEHGETVGVYQYLVTWPPKPLKGFIIPGWLAPDDATHPPELRFINSFRRAERRNGNRRHDYLGYAVRAVRHGLRPSTLLESAAYLLLPRRGRESLERHCRLKRIDISLNTDFFRRLLQRYQPTFAALVHYAPDYFGHYYWKYREPERFREVDPRAAARYGPAIDNIYLALDQAVGRILRTLSDDWTVVVTSDHGMGPASHPSGRLYRPQLAEFLEKSGLMMERPPATIGLDLFLDLAALPPSDGALERVLALFRGTTIVETGEQVFEIRPVADRHLAVRVKAARPELRRAAVRLPTGETWPYAALVNTREAVSGTHEPEGIIIAAGPGVRPGQTLEHARLIDVTPTMLAALDRPVARDMDGVVLSEIFRPEYLEAHPVRYVDSYESDAVIPPEDDGPGSTEQQAQMIKERLWALGYLE